VQPALVGAEADPEPTSTPAAIKVPSERTKEQLYREAKRLGVKRAQQYASNPETALDRLETAQDRRLRRRLRASRPLNTSKIAQPRSATAQSFQEPNHSRFGVPCTSQTMSQTKLATDRSLRHRCALAAQSTAQRGRGLQSKSKETTPSRSATRVASSRDRAPSVFSKLPT
jgi:hypothetical protein